MKKLYYIFAIAAVAAVACTKNAGVESAEPVDSFTLSMGDVQLDDETKTELILDGGKYNKLVWSAGDKVYVTKKSLAESVSPLPYAIYETSKDKVVRADFNLAGGDDISAGTGKYLVAYTSPIDYGQYSGEAMVRITSSSGNNYILLSTPVNQTYVANGIGQGVMPMVGVGTTLENVQLHCAGNILRFNLYNSQTASKTIKITKIVLKGDTQYLSFIGGAIAVYVDADGYSFGDIYGTFSNAQRSSRTVTLNCGTGVQLGATATPFNVVISACVGAGSLIGYLSATIYYTVNGGAEQTYGPVELTNLPGGKRKSFGHIYSFTAKDVSAF